MKYTVKFGSSSESIRNEFPCGPNCILFAQLRDANGLYATISQMLATLTPEQYTPALLELESYPPGGEADCVLMWLNRETPVDNLHVLALGLLLAGSKITHDVRRERASE